MCPSLQARPCRQLHSVCGGGHPADSATMRVRRFFHEMEGRWGRKASLECLAVFVPGCAGSARRHWFVHLGWWCA